MNIKATVSTLALSLLLLGLGTTLRSSATASAKAETPRVGIDVRIQPSAQTPDAIDCQLTVTDLATQREITRPTITTRRGEVAEVANGTAGGAVLRAKVNVDANGTTATYEVTMTDGDRLIARHAGNVVLQR